jgi:hypothetical protein
MIYVQAAVGFYDGIRRMTAVHAPPAPHPHEAIGPLKVKKLIFPHQAPQRTQVMIVLLSVMDKG